MKTHSPQHIIVGMSGGVDSSVAALLLKEQGHHVEGVFMKNWEEDDTDTWCPASVDMADAQAVCDLLQIELHRVNFAAEYWQGVFTHFLAEYRAGRTPNPDILCNREIKFKAFLDFAKKRGADFIATGHYARCQQNDAEFQLVKGLDPQKDQSYFLHALSQNQLAQSLFPIGHLEKTQVRELAQRAGFKNHIKKDSTGICFIGERKFKTFLSEYLPAQPGVIESVTGEVVGTHDGLMFYTLGQRQGLKIGGKKDAPESPWYVVEKNMRDNTLIVAQGHNHPRLYAQSLIANQVHWINKTPTFPLEASAKTRYRQADQTCIINTIGADEYQIVFNEPQRAITPGQSVVFYQENVCLGGGIIVGVPVDKNLENTTIALAGILQAISLMRELTQTGKTNEVAFEASMHSIFQFDAQTVPAVFGNLQGVRVGLEKIIHAFDVTPASDRLQSRYLLSLIYLQKRLYRSPKVLNALVNRLQQTQKQVDYFSLTHPTVVGNLADIYLHTISTFKFRFIISGSQRVLHVRENMEKVRALLLAGVRAAALWRQMGGSRLQLLFSRAKIKAAAEKILAQVDKDSL